MIDFYTWTKNIMILGAIIFLTKTKIYNWKKKTCNTNGKSQMKTNLFPVKWNQHFVIHTFNEKAQRQTYIYEIHFHDFLLFSLHFILPNTEAKHKTKFPVKWKPMSCKCTEADIYRYWFSVWEFSVLLLDFNGNNKRTNLFIHWELLEHYLFCSLIAGLTIKNTDPLRILLLLEIGNYWWNSLIACWGYNGNRVPIKHKNLFIHWAVRTCAALLLD